MLHFLFLLSSDGRFRSYLHPEFLKEAAPAKALNGPASPESVLIFPGFGPQSQNPER